MNGSILIVNVGRLLAFGIAEDSVTYCGRGWRKSTGEYVSSPLSNPYPRGRTPGATLPAYHKHLRKQWVQNPAVRAELERLAELHKRGVDLVLGCHCAKPETCHCSVIEMAVRKIADTLPEPEPVLTEDQLEGELIEGPVPMFTEDELPLLSDGYGTPLS